MKLNYQEKEIEVKSGSVIKEVFAEEIKKAQIPIVACKYNNEVRSLINCKISIIECHVL